MAPSIPASEPTAFAAGETVQWTRTFSDYPASDGWIPTYYCAGAGKFSIVGTPQGGGWLFLLTSALSADLPPGGYQWTAYAEKGAPVDRRWLANGAVEVTRNIVTAEPGDFLTHEEKTLAVIEAALFGRLTVDIANYSIDGRSVARHSMKELEGLRVRYAWAVWHQKNPGQIGAKVQVAFLPPDGSIGAPDPIALPPYYRYGG